jgi:cell division transport system permease protein
MPFVFEGALYGLVAAIVTVGLLSGISYYIAPLTQGAIPQGNFMNLYLGHFWYILGGLILLGVSLGVISSTIAIRRYLKA